MPMHTPGRGVRRALALLAACALAPAHAALSLQQAAAQAARRAPLVAAGRDREAAATADLDRAGRLPDPTLQLGIQNLPVQGAGAYTFSADPTTMRYVGVSQAIPSAATLSAQREAALAGRRLAHADLRQAAYAARRAAASAWVELWAAQRAQALLAELSTQAALAIQAAQARVAGATGSATDVLAARAQAAALDNRRDAVAAEAARARAELQRWLGPAQADATLGAAPDFARLPAPEAQLLGTPDAQVPLLDWGARVDAAQAALQRARATLSPDWSVGVSYAVRAPGLPSMAAVQVGVRLPLFARHREDADVDARDAELQALQQQRADARRAQLAAVARTLASWRGWNAQVARDESTLLALAHDRARTALAAYSAGAALQPWLDADSAEIEIRLGYVDALAARARAWVDLAYLIPGEQP
jgi:outer membrane protein TolC